MSIEAADAVELRNAVATVIRRAATTAILPRFRHLRDTDVSEKSPGEWVTVADREAEHILAEGLASVLPSARVVGEEACSVDPTLLQSLDEGLIWIVDPLDGTANFASGHEPFGIIVALASAGEVLAGWLYDPLSDRLCFGATGHGAELSIGGGARLALRTPPDPNKPIAALATQFMSFELREQVVAAAGAAFDLVPIPRCAAEHYPRLCRGENHIALFQRTLPWDHAAGALLLTQAGGRVARWDGSPYRFYEDRRGILAASSPTMWDYAARILVPEVALAEADSLRAADVRIPGLPN